MYLHLGKKKVSFQLSDPIFALEVPTKREYPDDTNCIVCEKELKRTHKHTCQFCGHKACEKCAYKLRVYANQRMDKLPDVALNELQNVCRMGRACRVCDRKFFLRE